MSPTGRASDEEPREPLAHAPSRRLARARFLVALALVAGACDGAEVEPREPRAPPHATPAFAPLSDAEVAELYAEAEARGGPPRAFDPSELCIRRVEGAPKYVRIGRPSRGGCALAAVCYERDCELARGDFNRFEGRLMRDLGWLEASASRRRELVLRWLREARFALEPGAGPLLVDEALARARGLDPPAVSEQDGMLVVTYWTREARRTRDAPDDWYWVERESRTTIDLLDGRPLGTGHGDERRVAMESPPEWAR